MRLYGVELGDDRVRGSASVQEVGVATQFFIPRAACLPALLLLVSCARGPLPQDQIAALYVPGTPHDELVQKLGSGAREAELDRPPGGWSELAGSDETHAPAALSVEEMEGVRVEHIDVYTVFRYSRTAPSLQFMPGMYWDYLCFDGERKLICYRRRFID